MTDTVASLASPGASKKRRLPGACDICRKRKIKCDSGEMPGNRCSHCISFNSECTRTPRKNELASQKEYIRYLEGRVALLEARLENPQQDILDGSRHSRPRNKVPHPELFYPTPRVPQGAPPSGNDFVHSTHFGETDDESDDGDDLGHIALTQHFSQMDLETIEGRFFGPSSAFILMKNAMMAKLQNLGPSERTSGEEFRRPVYWDIRPWERAYIKSAIPNYSFPPVDLLMALVGVYFDHVNVHMPLLHRHLFEKSLAENLHFLDPSFGATVLLVCAVASRHVIDPRVSTAGDNSRLSSGWSYFAQVPILRNYTLHKANIYDLQYYCLAAMYLFGTSVPNASWIFLGLGVRFAQEEGTHRRKAEGQKLTLEDELWKRAFWFLICFDRFSSSFLGRPLSIQDEDFDIDGIVECDDEYWECGVDSEVTFKQPLNKPSYVTSFACCLNLCEILAFSMRTLYSTKKAKVWSGHVGNEWQHRLVTQIDSALNRWSDSVPEHLKWDPHRENPLFFDQSTALYLVFYYVQMQIHRPLMQKDSPMSYTSLTVCTNAARACGHVLDTQFKKRALALPHVVISAFTAGVILLLGVWSARIEADPLDDIAVVQSCLHTLKTLEPTWHIAGRLWDMLNELANVREPQAGKLVPQRDPKQHILEPRGVPFPAQVEASTSSLESQMSGATGWGDSAALFSQPEDRVPHPPISVLDQDHDPRLVAADIGLHTHGFPHIPAFRGEHLLTPSIVEHEGCAWDKADSDNTSSNQTSRPIEPIEQFAISMWSNAPTSFNLAEWDAFIANMGRTGQT